MDNPRSARPGGTYLLRRAKSAAPSFRSQSNEMSPPEKVQQQEQQQPTLVLYVDKHCPVHGSQGKCTCTSYVTGREGLGSTHTLQQNGDHMPMVQERTHKEMNAIKVKPFTNNPSLPQTQRDIVGNNPYYGPSNNANGWNNEQYDPMMLYRDAMKQNFTPLSRSASGYSKMRVGRSGGHWRHIQQTNSHGGANLLYINGTVRVDENQRYLTPRFGYPPLNYGQPNFASPSTYDSSNPATNSLDAATWSARGELNRRPSLTQYSNRYQEHAREGFAYWPSVGYQKPRCKNGTTGTYKTWLGLSDSILKL